MAGSPIIWIMVAAAVFCLWVIVANLLNIRRAQISKNWPSVTGRIVTSSFRAEHRDSDSSDRYIADIQYTYDVTGQTYSGNRVAYGLRKEVKSRRTLEELIQRYTTGSEVSVYYNPDDPSSAVLEQGNSRFAVGNITAGLIVLAVLLYFLWRNIG